MDDIDTLRKKRAIKVITTDIFMAVSVVLIVFILVAAVAGWRINSDFTVEQNGLVSIKTRPNGAKIIIDEKDNNQSTNARIMLPGGEHKIEIEKDGYERWEKTVKITPGWLLRLEYPKLFKQNRTKNALKKFETLSFFNVSPNHNTAIFSEDNIAEWTIITDLNSEKPQFQKINIKDFFSHTDDEFNLTIKSMEWNKNNEKLLINSSEENEWVIIDLKDVKNSINITRDYSKFKTNTGAPAFSKRTKKNITDVKFENESGEKLIAILSESLIRIDVPSKTVSESVADGVTDFKVYGTTVAYSTKFKEGRSFIKLLRLGDKNPTIAAVNTDKDAVLSYGLTRFNSTSYFLYTINNHLYIFKSNDFPSNGGSKLNMKKIIDEETGVIPSEVIISNNSEFIVLREGSRVIVFDTELEEWYEYDYGDEKVRFLDNYILYRVDEESGKFLAWDFDSTNVRTLVVDKGLNEYDAGISTNNHFFYYIAKTKNGVALVQENL